MSALNLRAHAGASVHTRRTQPLSVARMVARTHFVSDLPSRYAGAHQSVVDRKQVGRCHASVARTLESLTAQPSFDAADVHGARRDGSVLVSFDGSAAATATVAWALKHLAVAEDPHERVDIVHVTCDPRATVSPTAVGSSATRTRTRFHHDLEPAAASQIKEHKARLQARARAVVLGACGSLLEASGISHRLHTPELDGPRSAAGIGAVLINSVQVAEARMLVVANHGPGVACDFGSVARYCYLHSPVPLVLVPHMAPNTVAAVSNASQVLLVVSKLEELEAHWKWVADNLCRKGNTLTIWHVNPDSAHPSGLASLPVALAQALRAHGLSDVRYKPVYNEAGAEAVAHAVVEEVSGSDTQSGNTRLVVVMNYARQGMVAEAMHGGSVASFLSRSSPVPLVLLEPAL